MANKTGFALLDKWQRKHYHFKITFGGGYQPGDGLSVTLFAACRTVIASSDDKTLEQLIEEAVTLWHADTTVKNYKAFWAYTDSVVASTPDIKIERWGNSGLLCARLEATSEAEALKILKDTYGALDIVIYETM